MNYTQLINNVLQKIDQTAEEVYTLTINMDSRTVTVLTGSFAKYIVPFDIPEPDEFNQDPEPRPRRQTKRVKNVKQVD